MRALLSALVAIGLCSIGSLAQDKAKSQVKPKKARPVLEMFTDAAKAGPDYLVQGEYLGEWLGYGKVGVQVVAEGDGKFTWRFLQGGLPGDGWDGKKTSERFKVQTQKGIATFDAGLMLGDIRDGKLTIHHEGGAGLTILKRVERRSSTLGKQPPAGAVVLFDGKSADQWKNGQLVEDNLLRQGATTKSKFKDYTLHIEFRTPFVPKGTGQSRGNSGVYLQGMYEIQILDSFGLDGKNNECGGLYQIAAPSVNMCYPPLAWQTYDIDFTAAKFDDQKKKTAEAVVTVRHNGVVIHDHVKIKGPTGGHDREEGPDPGTISLQNHSNPVYFRNIWLVEKK